MTRLPREKPPPKISANQRQSNETAIKIRQKYTIK
jgi:hypothetical protein